MGGQGEAAWGRVLGTGSNYRILSDGWFNIYTCYISFCEYENIGRDMKFSENPIYQRNYISSIFFLFPFLPESLLTASLDLSFIRFPVQRTDPFPLDFLSLLISQEDKEKEDHVAHASIWVFL